MGTMSTMLLIPATQIPSPGAQNGPAAPPKPGAAGDPSDPAFGILMGQLLATILQNGQQTPMDAAKLSDSAGMLEQSPQNGQQPPLDAAKLDGGMQKAGKPLEQPQAQPTAQQEADLSKLFLGIQNQDKTIDEENAATRFSESLKNIKGNAEDHDPAQKAPADSKGRTSADGNAQTEQNDLDGKNVFYLADKSGKHDAAPLQNAVLLNRQDENDEGRKKIESMSSGPAKTDFATLVQQAQSSGQHTAPRDAAVPTTDTQTFPAAMRPHGVDSPDAFDHAVSIVKDGNRIAVQLDHNGLGKLDINLSLDKGAVNAQINVADDATRKVIENNMQQIVNSLLGEGVSVGGFSVSLRQQGTRDGSDWYRQDGAQQSNRPALQPVSAPRAAAAQGTVNIFI
jgi:flagellar hook-length control protein FliK